MCVNTKEKYKCNYWLCLFSSVKPLSLAIHKKIHMHATFVMQVQFLTLLDGCSFVRTYAYVALLLIMYHEFAMSPLPPSTYNKNTVTVLL